MLENCLLRYILGIVIADNKRGLLKYNLDILIKTNKTFLKYLWVFFYMKMLTKEVLCSNTYEDT